MARILITGLDGFTGQHLSRAAIERGHAVAGLKSSLTDADGMTRELSGARHDWVVHLAGISAVTHKNQQDFFSVNLFGTLNLLSAIEASGYCPHKIILASSANVYGNAPASPISEYACPDPVNLYAMSKLAMEKMARSHFSGLPVVILRPFNYTGVGQDLRFVIPKIVAHFSQRADTVELGNVNVEREFNDVRAVCHAYLELLEKGLPGEVYNFCSGRAHSLTDVISLMHSISGHEIRVKINPDFVRPNEVRCLAGDPEKLESCIGSLPHPSLEETLRWMLSAAR